MDIAQLEHLLLQFQLARLDTEGQQRLRQALVDSAEARAFAARWMQNESLLRGELLMGEVARLFTDSSAAVPVSHSPSLSQLPRRDESSRPVHPVTPARAPRRSSSWLLAVAIGLIGLLLANSWLLLKQWEPRGESPLVAHTPPPPSSPQVNATLLDTTVCVWSTSDGIAPTAGQRLVEGDSFQLLEGIATIALDYGETHASLEVEGPASVMLARGGLPSLRYGKITFKVEGQSGKRFPLETAFGRVVAQSGSETGIVSFGSKGQVHVFKGQAVVESAWLASQEGELPEKVVGQGRALLLTNVGGNTLQARLVDADRSTFTPNVSMEADFLDVSRQYVEEIEAARPVAYWRFEEVVDGATPCHLPAGPPLNVKGEVKWVGPDGNRAVEFGMSPNAGLLLCEESLDEALAGDFSIELWMKPSHYHYGAMVALAGPYDQKRRINPYGVGIELGGTYYANSYQRPRQVRSFFRTPLAVSGGYSAFSGDAHSGETHEYRTRRWQHVVMVHRETEIALYLDSQLVGSASKVGVTPRGLQLFFGQLYTGSVARPYVGNLDEVALYDRALAPDEIQLHYNLLRSETLNDATKAVSPAPVEATDGPPIPGNALPQLPERSGVIDPTGV